MGVLLGVFTVRAHPTASARPPQLRQAPLPQQLILISHHRPTERPDPKPHCLEAPRRAALLLLFLPAVTTLFSIPRRAEAFSISISQLSSHSPISPTYRCLLSLFYFLIGSLSALEFWELFVAGPKNWLRDQKKKAARFVLAPIDASLKSLRNAYLVLESSAGDAGELRKLLNSAARDCVPRDWSSFVAFQASTGVEVCTFRLIVKNAASLLDDGDPLKLEAETRLEDLIRSFSFLGGTIDSCDLSVTSDREKVKLHLMQTIFSLDKFEQSIKDCLGV